MPSNYRLSVCSIAALTLASGAMANGPKFTLTPISPPAGASGGPMLPGYINSTGMVAGEGTWSGGGSFVFVQGRGTLPINLDAGLAMLGVRGLNDAGQVLAEACVMPAGGNGFCGEYLFRDTPRPDGGFDRLRIDNLPGAPVGLAFYPPIMNSAGSVAVTAPGSFGNAGSAAVYSDALGWQSLAALLDGVTVTQPHVIDLNDAGQVLMEVAYLGPTYRITPDTPAQRVLLEGFTATDMNNLGDVTGCGPDGPFRTLGGELVDLDPNGLLPGACGRFINDAGMVAGTWDHGYFLYTPETGSQDLGQSGPGIHPGAITSLNANGEFTSKDHDPNTYEVISVVKIEGQPLMRVQDLIDPNHERIDVGFVSPINDAGQFAVGGTAPGAGSGGLAPVAFLVTPEASCAADFNHDGAVGVQDIFDYLAAYFAAASTADMDASPGLGANDLFTFLASYFAGCPR